MAFVRFVECTLPLDVVDGASGCVCMLRATAQCRENKTELDKWEKQNNRTHTTVGKWFGMISFKSVLSTLHVVWASTPLYLSSTELP